jgi:predicted Zn-ribbon and HTH transcriptional regulator
VGAGSGQPAARRGGVELADIFRAYGKSYRRHHPLPVSHLKVLQTVERCRTAALGGHLQQCDACGFERPAYNSCRNRHCPKCQSFGLYLAPRTQPLDPGQQETSHQYPVSIGLADLSAVCPESSGRELGITAVLHTWEQTLLDHFHLHCLVPAGALSVDQKR